ncbi:50S ribosomal protein L6 [candidate division WOR-1 bacterium RIFCSPHIGHO2_01_FULL_53_15]|uniref:Large ribosomal subunit protein uL6 n=1 Tax=candidate division WOR-1 bacterium RIFCSPHIGHO2_01_FULL_53_15 TaxID=1802564 RepID=A0A1F4Q3W5_UNCSA|nr:MAG: 50S ribosomal protein L6 [candidate division WOR-1 bacterium RIFCSPHIGHO2_01_FULL_53_15]OGC12501.1 MAG: 50S ribosomal protein L6 [candidate division WOR-1 bacterium RIFCSPHIGHO2_02_FULL_53_26]
MARIGKRALEIPKGVDVKVTDGVVNVKGPKGALTQAYDKRVEIKVEGGKVLTLYSGSDRSGLALQGLYNSLIKNMLAGVTAGFEKDLEMVGVGYRAQMQGKKLQLQAGYSHLVDFDPPAGIEFVVTANTKIKIKGFDRQVVGQVAADIRAAREVEPYKGKGIKYAGEVVRRKAGKAAKATTAGGA